VPLSWANTSWTRSRQAPLAASPVRFPVKVAFTVAALIVDREQHEGWGADKLTLLLIGCVRCFPG
jgi:hypothetical protein